VDQISGTGGTVQVPAGTYMVDAVRGIRIGSDTTLRLSSGATVKAIPNDKGSYSILRIVNASNVTVIGGVLVGERDEHKGTTGEWGMGALLRSATNVIFEGVTAKNAWGDGFYIDGQSRNVKFCSVTADNNRRQGMSIVSGDGIIVKDSVFKNTNGTTPQAGIDIEPNDHNKVSNVQIVNSQFLNNKGLGIQIWMPIKRPRSVTNVEIERNLVVGNKGGGIGIYNSSGHVVANNIVKDNAGFGIHLDKYTKAISVVGNQLVGPNSIRDEGGNPLSRNTRDGRPVP